MLLLDAATQPSHNSKLCWNSEIKGTGSQAQSLGTAAHSFHPPKCLSGPFRSSELVTPITIITERQTHVGLTAFVADFTCLPTGREGNGLLETSSLEMSLQQALDLCPVSWHDSRQDLLQCNAALLPYTSRLKGGRTDGFLPPPHHFPISGTLSLLLLCCSATKRVKLWPRWKPSSNSGAGAVLAGLEHRPLPDSRLQCSNHIPLP